MKRKIFQKKQIAILIVLLVLLLPTWSQAQIAVDVDIDVGEITILYSFTDIDVELDAAALGAILANGCTVGTNSLECDEGDAGGPVTAVENAGNLEAAFNIAPGIVASNAVPLVLQNVWAVRAIGGASANTTVTVTVPAATTITNGASSIAVTAGTAAPGTFADPGLGAPQVGDVTLTLDFTNLSADGNHDSGADTGDTVYTIEVTAT
ncbi:hypothetical protein [Marinicella sp. W31]|uniref:hypothetical protein n=1 Tax=Marinicella sp. W31 TaxID=3023713 RepID=UPI003757AFC0